MDNLKFPRAIIITALILGWVGDYFFYGNPLGISVPIYVGLLIIALIALGGREQILPSWGGIWLAVPLMFFAVMIFIRANPFVTFLNLMACLGLLGLLVHFYVRDNIAHLGLIGYPFTLLESVLNTLSRPVPLMAVSTDVATIREQGRRNVFPLLRGLALAIPIVAAFTCLLASADLVFASYVESFIELDFLSDVFEWIWRGIIILILAWLIAGGLSYAFSRAFQGEISLQKAARWTPPAFLGFIEVTTILVAVNILFLIFVLIQFTYLFGGQANITETGYTYAEYARQGFFELLAVAVISLGLILGLHRLGKRGEHGQTLSFNALSSLMIGLVIVILISAFQRLLLYETVFGYTQLRLYSHIFMIWLGISCLWFVITLWWHPYRFAIGAFVAALGFLVTLNFVNPDAFIARQNLARETIKVQPDFGSSRVSMDLDAYYLTQLSDDAVPVLVAEMANLDTDERLVLQHHFARQFRRLEERVEEQRWVSYHLAEQRAYQLLAPFETD